MSHSRHEDKTHKGKKYYTHKVYSKLSSIKKIQMKDVNGTHFHHKLWLVNKPPKLLQENKESLRNTKKWFCKAIENEQYEQSLMGAICETVAQEFLRLQMPWHPKTRYWMDRNEKIYVLSEAIHEFQDFDYFCRKDYETLKKKITLARDNFAEVLVTALFLNEFDMKMGNLGFDSHGRILKIDGESCFADLYDGWHKDINVMITPQDLKSLPDIEDYNPYNWLHLIAESFREKHSQFFGPGLAEDSQFQAARNKAILKILILPDEFFHHFVASYIELPTISRMLSHQMIMRRDMLKEAAFQLKDFRQYLESQAEKNADLNNYFKSLMSFKTMSKYVLWQHIPDISNLLNEQYKAIKKHLIEYELLDLIEKQQYNAAQELLRQTPNLDLNFPISSEKNSIIHVALNAKSNIQLVKLLCEAKSPIDLAVENASQHTPLSLSAKNQDVEAATYFLSQPIFYKQFTPSQLERALLYFIFDNQYDLALLLLKNRPDVSQGLWQMDSTDCIHKAVAEQKPNLEVIKGLCHSKADIFKVNKEAKSALSIAINKHQHEVVKILLTAAKSPCEWREMHQAILFLSEEKTQDKISDRIYLLKYIKQFAPGKQKAACAGPIIKKLINQATSAHEVYDFVIDIGELEGNSFFKRSQEKCCSFSMPQWEGQNVSTLWITLIEHAKLKIISLAEVMRNFDDDAQIINFLKMPTSRWGTLFSTVPTEVKDYLKLKEAKSIHQQEFKHKDKKA